MKNVLIISTSFRKGGNSESLAEEFARGAQESGNKVEKVYLRDKNIGFCKGCLACVNTNRCVIKDDAAEIVEKMLAAGVKPVYNTVIEEIAGGMKVEKLILKNTQTGEKSEVAADAVFVFAGMTPASDLVDMLKKDEAGYIVTDEKMQTMIPGLFVAGDVRAKPFRQIVTAVSDGAIAANSAAEMIHNS